MRRSKRKRQSKPHSRAAPYELRCFRGECGSFAGCERALALSICFNVVGRRCFLSRSRNASLQVPDSSTYGLWRASPRLGLHYDAKTMQPQEAARAIAPDLSVHVVLPSIGLDLHLKGHKREHDGNAYDVDGAEGDEIWCHGERLITRTHAKLRADIRSVAPTKRSGAILVPECVKNYACTCNQSAFTPRYNSTSASVALPCARSERGHRATEENPCPIFPSKS